MNARLVPVNFRAAADVNGKDMRLNLYRLAVLLVSASVVSWTATSNAQSAVTLPANVENFRLLDHTGRSVELYREVDSSAVVVYIHGVGCPMVRQMIPELTRIQSEFEPQGVKFYMLNANSQDSRGDLVKDVNKYKIPMPILHDESQRITHAMGCRRTAEVLVIDPQSDWQIIYRGPVDDRFDYGAQKEEPKNAWLRDALQAHLAGEPVTEKQVTNKGCLIRFLNDEAISYTKEVAPILSAKCVSCHCEGGVGPFAMSSYDEVAGWAAMIRETIRADRMPPWHADPEYGTFHNGIGLTTDEERTLLTWLEQGAPSDLSETDPLRALGSPNRETWQLGTPDLIVELPQVEKIPAEGVVDYRYISVPSGLTEDRWIRAIDVQPTDLSVVHHALIFILYPPEYRHLQPEAKNGLNGFFASFLPGGNVQPLPKETGSFVPAGSTFVFQMHYTTTGIAATDQTKMGLYFLDEPPQHVLRIKAAVELDFEIPPHAMDSPAEAIYRFNQDSQLLGLAPHMHYRGSRFRFDAKFPNGEQQTLLSVPFYVFDCQPMYFFEKPISVSQGTELHCVGAFDNSKFNPRNPNPEDRVRFGEQSYEEMFIGYVASSVPYQQENFIPRDANPDKWEGYGKQITASTLAGTSWKLGRRLKIHFSEDGKLKFNGFYPGTWNLEEQSVHIKSGRREINLDIRLDELVLRGRPLRRIPAGE